MHVPFERRALSFNGKPVMVYVSGGASPLAGAMVLARCRGAGMLAEQEAATEDEFVARIQAAVASLGYQAVLQTLDERQITIDVRRSQ